MAGVWRNVIGRLGALALAAGVFAFGCASQHRAALDQLEASKPASIQAGGWSEATIAGQPAQDWVWDRSAIVVAGVGGGEFGVAFGPDRTKVRKQKKEPGDEQSADAGSAAAISPDGYFLTAAHCVEKSPVWLVVRTWAGQPEVLAARVVWAGDESRGGPDLAIVHVERWTDRYLLLASAPAIPREVLSCGSGIGSGRWCAGRGLGVGGGEYAGVPCTTVRHSSPVSLGDSGGPAIDATGVLIGVNIEVEVEIGTGVGEATAVRPGQAWLDAQLQKDRARRAGRG